MGGYSKGLPVHYLCTYVRTNGKQCQYASRTTVPGVGRRCGKHDGTDPRQLIAAAKEAVRAANFWLIKAARQWRKGHGSESTMWGAIDAHEKAEETLDKLLKERAGK